MNLFITYLLILYFLGHHSFWKQPHLSIPVWLGSSTQNLPPETHPRGDNQETVWKIPDHPRHACAPGQVVRSNGSVWERNPGRKINRNVKTFLPNLYSVFLLPLLSYEIFHWPFLPNSYFQLHLISITGTFLLTFLNDRCTPCGCAPSYCTTSLAWFIHPRKVTSCM